MMGGWGSGGRAAGGQEVKSLFSDPWSSALEQDAELQIISNVASPSVIWTLMCDFIKTKKLSLFNILNRSNGETAWI